MKYIRVAVPIYGNTLHVFLGGTRKEFHQRTQKSFEWGHRIYTEEVVIASTWNIGANQVIHYGDWGGTVAQMGVLVHELTHVALNVLHRAGVTLTSASDEAVTYLLEYLFVNVVQRIKTKKGDRK